MMRFKEEFRKAIEGNDDEYIELDNELWVYECGCLGDKIDKEMRSVNVVQFPRVGVEELELSKVEFNSVVIEYRGRVVSGLIGECDSCGTYYYYVDRK